MKNDFTVNAAWGALFAVLAIVISWFVSGAWEEWDTAIGAFAAVVVVALLRAAVSWWSRRPAARRREVSGS